MQNSDEETAVFRAVQAGDTEAFRKIVEWFQGPVFRVCAQFLCDRGSAEDIAQETFITAYRKIHLFDPERGRPLTWLLTIARRLCINSTHKRRTIPIADFPNASGPAEHEPDRLASRTDTFQALDRALAELSEDHRRVFVLAEIEELSHAKIAEIEGIAVGTVKSRVSRAKQVLQSCLRAEFKEITEP